MMAECNEMEQVIRLYEEVYHTKPSKVERLAGAGSNRLYCRLVNADGTTLIGVRGTSVEENTAFIKLSRHFRTKQLCVPEVLAVSKDGCSYLQTDLGKKSLYDALAEGRAKGHYSEGEIALLKDTIAKLPEFQIRGAEGCDFNWCYPMPEMNRMNIFFDLNYFKYCFLKINYEELHELYLEQDFNRLADDLLNGYNHAFLYRDFQARNVMLDENNKPYFIDFQGGRKGPLEYDVASFLWQASANYGSDLRNELVEVYLEALSKLQQIDRQKFHSRLRIFVLFRTLQVLGAYGFRGYVEKKVYFINSIKPALENLRALLNDGVCRDYPYLERVLTDLVQRDDSITLKETGQSSNTKPSVAPQSQEKLIVRVFSFSYKKGIPEDESGNGGGYVFDCRSTHNPGRYEPYKTLTGLDKPVIDFLENDGEIVTFLSHVYDLADKHVERYMERGFTHLMFSFGCTGGQHRSVYSAQHLAQHLHEKYGIEVRLCHREQSIEQVFK